MQQTPLRQGKANKESWRDFCSWMLSTQNSLETAPKQRNLLWSIFSKWFPCINKLVFLTIDQFIYLISGWDTLQEGSHGVYIIVREIENKKKTDK